MRMTSTAAATASHTLVLLRGSVSIRSSTDSANSASSKSSASPRARRRSVRSSRSIIGLSPETVRVGSSCRCSRSSAGCTGLHGAQWRAQDFGGLGLAQPGDEPARQRLAIVLGQTPKRGCQRLVLESDFGGLVGRLRRSQVQSRMVIVAPYPAHPAADVVLGVVGHDPQHPRPHRSGARYAPRWRWTSTIESCTMSSASVVDPQITAATRNAADWWRRTSWAKAARSSLRARASNVRSSQSASSAGRIRIELFYESDTAATESVPELAPPRNPAGAGFRWAKGDLNPHILSNTGT